MRCATTPCREANRLTRHLTSGPDSIPSKAEEEGGVFSLGGGRGERGWPPCTPSAVHDRGGCVVCVLVRGLDLLDVIHDLPRSEKERMGAQVVESSSSLSSHHGDVAPRRGDAFEDRLRRITCPKELFPKPVVRDLPCSLSMARTDPELGQIPYKA